MSEQLMKNSSKKLISIVGIASASVFLSFPAFALINSNASGTNQRLNTHTSSINSTTGSSENLLAQSGTGNGPSTSPSTPGGSDATSSPSTPSGGSNTTPSRSTPSGGSDTAPSTSQGRTAGGTGYSTDEGRLIKGTWLCLNNPNPKCNS